MHCAAGKPCCVILRRKRVGKLKDPCDACGRFGGEPAMVNSDQQTRLSGRKRECRPLERSVVGDLWDLPSEPNPLPQIKDPSQRQLTPYIDSPGDRRDGYCRLSSSNKLASQL
jgi:hypothetical protein